MKIASGTLVACGVLLAACGSSNGGNTNPAFLIRISSLSFSPVSLSVPPGADVVVVNDDGPMSHSVTSEAAAGDFTPGSVGGVSFDTGEFTGQTHFVIPSSAPDGIVVPYYCTVHKGVMNTPDGSITIDAGATAQARRGTSSGGR